MAIPYTNPYYAQFYPENTEAYDNGPIALPPCKNAYSVGPTTDQTTISVRWSSVGYSFGGSVSKSKCTLIKDENDFFYYIIAYVLSGNLRVHINAYDAENDIDNDYNVTPPAQLAGLRSVSDVNSWFWVMRKSSDTTMDFVVRGERLLSDGHFEYQHYIWTIGETTLTYVGGTSYDPAVIGTSLCMTLHGSQIIDVTYKSPRFRITTYNLDSQTASDSVLFDSTGIGAFEDYVVGIYHAGELFHCAVFYSEIVSTGDCPEIPPDDGIRHDVRKGARLFLSGFAYSLSGPGNSYNQELDTVTGHDCYIKDIAISGGDQCSMNPDTGEVYFRMKYTKAYSGLLCPIDPYINGIPGAPDTVETVSGYFSLDGTNGGFYDYLIFTDTWSPTEGTTAIGPGRYVYPSRTDPMSIIYSSIDVSSHLLHWLTGATGAEDVFIPAAIGGTNGNLTLEGGQRNDNSPILISIRDKDSDLPANHWHNVWKTIGGGTYVDQDSNTGGTTTPSYPVAGFMGKWPVRHTAGRWQIFGPNTYIERGPNWQVV